MASTHVASCLEKKSPSKLQDRPSAYFPPSIWSQTFLQNTIDFNKSQEKINANAKELEELREEIRDRLVHANMKPMETIQLINSLDRLGVSYHFEKEIEEKLELLFSGYNHIFEDDHSNEHDLFDVSLRFRVFRQHGYKLPSDVFNKFTNDKGKFKESLKDDVKGMLSLYEGTQLSIRGEDIMDEAFEFTKTHLEDIVTKLNHPLSTQVKQALERPIHRNMPRLESRLSISTYEEDKSTNDQSILRFAKMDFNKLQILHQQELSSIMKWWEETVYSSNLRDYVRDRIVELYFWILGVHFEPHYSLARIIGSKVISLACLLDDTYGMVEELRNLTEAINMWESTAKDQLPDNMKIVYNVVMEVFDEIEEYMARERRSYAFDYAKQAMKEQVRCYHKEAEWVSKGYTPTYDEYIENGCGSSTFELVMLSSLLGLADVTNRDAFEFIMNKPKLLRACQTIGRLQDDISSHKYERKRLHVDSSIECLMKEKGVEEEIAREMVNKKVKNAWKDLNEGYLKPTAAPWPVIVRLVNLTRMSDVFYRYGDGFTFPEIVKGYIESVLFMSVCLI